MGIDCSGLVQVVYKICGIKLPRDASQQYLCGKPVALDQSKAGDLAFFANAQGRIVHVGIVVDSCGTKLIVHAVPGERDFEGDVDRVKADLPERFFSTEFTSIGEICRPADSIVAERAASIAWQAYKRHTLFDHSYDDADTTRLYCTELVVYAFSRAGCDIVEGRGHHINLPILQADCVFPSDIYVSDFLTSVSQF